MLAIFVPAANTHGEVTQKPMQTSQHQLITSTHQTYFLYLLIGHLFVACRTPLDARKMEETAGTLLCHFLSFFSIETSQLHTRNVSPQQQGKYTSFPPISLLIFSQNQLPSPVISLRNQQLSLSFPLF